MSVSQLSNRLSPFGVPRRDRRGAFAALVEEGPGRRDPEAFAAFEVGLHKRLLGRAVLGKCAEGRERRSGPPGRSGFYRSTEATSKTHIVRSGRVLPFAVPLAGKPVVLAGRRKPGPAIISRIRRRAALSRSCAIARRGTGPKSSKGWGYDPIVELPQASVDEGGQALEGGGGGGHGRYPRGGNGAGGSGLLRCLARRGDGFRFAPTGTGKRAGARRPAGRSVSMARMALV